MKRHTVHKAVFPVAGWGTRWLPTTKTIPKELLPVGDLPLIHHVVEEAVSSGMEELLFVISKGKETIPDYFREDADLTAFLQSRGRMEIMDSWLALCRKLQVGQVIQKEARGLGDAVYQARNFSESSPFAVLLPDDLVFSQTPCMAQMAAIHNEFGGAVLALERVPIDQISRYGVIDGEEVKPGIFRVRSMVEKPKPEDAPSDLAVIGRYILPPEIFPALEDLPPGAGGEIQLTDAIARLISDTGVVGVIFEGTRYDAGYPLGWLFTNLKYFSEDPRFLDHSLLQSIRNLIFRQE
ncbi:MAG TPA: UTP--glucose-1-phosphate uridylyltransferase [Thermoanaerobaculia bacterium]|nr:UTP--glucose-1-phosphate uridylyltransferase [Thermoanaerobaculia bacterium]HUM30542.1 UTP--glucose-1-phosphate uridylyltransferase [Thermoanaerobaculia bacterium]HXK68734.1 UTP--glucose-1-phosphate uridylyltransferase [Thermoanaerobaculia bacterium]